MWKIPKPLISAVDSFDTCIAGIANANLKQRMRTIRQDIVHAESAFDSAARAANLPIILPANNVGAITAKEMASLYDRHMARPKSRGRSIYETLTMAAPYDQCPLCGHRDVSTLDHSLPKAQHPALAVTPVNLTPCCKDCNHSKGNLAITSKADQLLNPYYDDVTNDLWLYAEIVRGSPPGARFFVNAPGHWSAELSGRVDNHFERLKLAKLYASQAGRQLQNMRGALIDIYNAAGKAAVRQDLERRFRGCSQVSINSWEGALYKAAAASEWYCDGGFVPV